MRHSYAALTALAAMAAIPADAREFRIATWNLGWHLSQAEAERWIDRCGSPFAFDAIRRRWHPAQAGTPGWRLDWGRDAPIDWDSAALPPCNVFRAGQEVVPVTAAAYGKRARQIAQVIASRVTPDVIAFQEVSGPEAVREALPEGGAGYEVCSFDGHKVQRLAFAWRRELGAAEESCRAYEPLSLPDLAPEARVRPGLSVGLRVDGKLVRFLTVHLKSSCVSPLEAGSDPDGRGSLSGGNEACVILRRQAGPLEAWIEERAAGADRLVLLGDFNRNLWHEERRLTSEPVRTDGSDPASPLGQGARVRNLLGEVNDGSPPETRLTLLDEKCEGATGVRDACARAKETPLDREETRILAAAEGLGCRNPIGLDHILLGPGLGSVAASKVPLGTFGRTKPATERHPDPLLAVSDHCPLVAAVRF